MERVKSPAAVSAAAGDGRTAGFYSGRKRFMSLFDCCCRKCGVTVWDSGSLMLMVSGGQGPLAFQGTAR